MVITAFVITASLHSEAMVEDLLRQSEVHKHKNTKCPDFLTTGESCCTGSCPTVTSVQLLSSNMQACEKKHTRNSFWDNSCSD